METHFSKQQLKDEDNKSSEKIENRDLISIFHQSIINGKVTVNFENVKKKVINANNVELKKIG